MTIYFFGDTVSVVTIILNPESLLQFWKVFFKSCVSSILSWQMWEHKLWFPVTWCNRKCGLVMPPYNYESLHILHLLTLKTPEYSNTFISIRSKSQSEEWIAGRINLRLLWCCSLSIHPIQASQSHRVPTIKGNIQDKWWSLYSLHRCRNTCVVPSLPWFAAAVLWAWRRWYFPSS